MEYGVSPIMMSPFTVWFGCQLSRKQLEWNAAMSCVCIEVEHRFEHVLLLWSFICCWWKHQLFLSSVGR
jgi:hypothetical protein